MVHKSIWGGVKGLATIASFFPPTAPFAIPISAGMNVAEAGYNASKGKWGKAGMNALMALPGLDKIPGVSRLAQVPGISHAVQGYKALPESAKIATKLSLRQAYKTLYQREQWKNQQGQRPPSFFLRPTIGQQQGGGQNPFRAIRNPYMGKQRLPQFAGGGIAGVPRLPDNFEGYVDKPHIVSLGERGTEVVVPLWKLMQQTRRY